MKHLNYPSYKKRTGKSSKAARAKELVPCVIYGEKLDILIL